jgi:hypothetical protein
VRLAILYLSAWAHGKESRGGCRHAGRRGEGAGGCRQPGTQGEERALVSLARLVRGKGTDEGELDGTPGRRGAECMGMEWKS